MLNKFLINPAFAGAEGYTSINLSSRKNWVSEMAPGYVSASAHTRIMTKTRMAKKLSIKKRTKKRKPKGRVGVGCHVYTDKNAAVSQTGVLGTYSYHVPIRSSQLSMGFSLSAFQFKVHTELLRGEVEGDPLLSAQLNKFNPDGNIGFFYTIYGYYVGYSSSELFGNLSRINFSNDGLESISSRSHTLVTGYLYDMENDFEIEGSALFNIREGRSFEKEISVKGVYLTNYWLGLSFRNNNQNSQLVTFLGGGYQSLYFGYSVDISLKTSGFSRSAHEIFIGYRFGDNKRRYRWLNRF